jgi:hypothetical protein
LAYTSTLKREAVLPPKLRRDSTELRGVTSQIIVTAVRTSEVTYTDYSSTWLYSYMDTYSVIWFRVLQEVEVRLRKLKITIIWDVTLCSLVKKYQYFGVTAAFFFNVNID